MITIRSVIGEVAVFDQTLGYAQSAVAGMQLTPGHNYLVVPVKEKAEATLVGFGKTTKLAYGEYYVITRNGEIRQGKHREKSSTRLFFGRLWAFICKEHEDLKLPQTNAAIGVRG